MKVCYFLQCPDVISNPGFHSRRDSRCLVDAPEVVIHEMNETAACRFSIFLLIALVRRVNRRMFTGEGSQRHGSSPLSRKQSIDRFHSLTATDVIKCWLGTVRTHGVGPTPLHKLLSQIAGQFPQPRACPAISETPKDSLSLHVRGVTPP